MIKIIGVSLFLFFHAVSAQTLSIDESSEDLNLIPEENQSVSETSVNYGKDSSLVTKTSGLNGKIELGGLLLLKASASGLVEFERQIFNRNLMWLFQMGGGVAVSHGSSDSIDGLASSFIPYASVHTGLRYQFDWGFTASLAMGIRTFEIAPWSMVSLGWNIKNKVHVEMGLASIVVWPIALILSIGIPLKRW